MRNSRTSSRLLPIVLPIFLVGIVFILTFLGGTAQANRSLDLERLDVSAEVLPDASMQVTEYLTIDFSGQWHGFNRSLPIEGNTRITDIQVYEEGQPYDLNLGSDYGPPGTFLVQDHGDGLLVDWSIDVLDETRTFALSYKVVNAVAVHSDVAELYRKFIGETNETPVGAVTVTMKLPSGAADYEQGTEIRVWGHGPLNGEVNFTGSDEVTWTIDDVSANTMVEGRVVMPTALFPEAPPEARTNSSVLQSILAEEEEWAGEANRQRRTAKAETGGALAVVLGSLAAVVVLWRKFGRSHPVSFDGEYYRELPGDYSPGELSSLWNFKDIKAQDLTATILDLARRKFLRIDEEIVERERFLLGTKKEETYRLTFVPAPDPASLRKPEEAELRPHEKELLDYLKDNVASGRDFLYLSEIEDYAKDHSKDFYAFWQGWKEGLNLRGDYLNFFDSNSSMILKTVLVGIAMLLLAALVMTRMPLLGAAMIVGGIIIVIVPLLFKRRSPSGQEDYVKWKAFRKFLVDFSQMDTYQIPSLVIWEHYLVYAVTLGVAKEVIKQLELVYPNMQDGDYSFGYGWFYFGPDMHFAGLQNSFDSITNSVDQAISTAQAAVTPASSGSGGGGGFSGGGGGGGGGGGFGGR